MYKILIILSKNNALTLRSKDLLVIENASIKKYNLEIKAYPNLL